MPRTVRRLSENNLYHIVLKGNNSDTLFFSESDYAFFLKEFKRACADYKAEIVAYCLMRNHVHLLIKFAESDSMSLVFKSFGASYCYKYNKKYKRTGRLFNSRYYSKPVNDDEYLFAVLKYIHYNPVNSNICKEPKDYKWSSYIEYQDNCSGYADKQFIENIMTKNEFDMLHICNENDFIWFFVISNSIEKADDNRIKDFYNELMKNNSLEEAISIMRNAGISTFKMEKVLKIPRNKCK